MCDTSLTQPWRKITYKYLNIKILQQICLIAEGKDTKIKLSKEIIRPFLKKSKEINCRFLQKSKEIIT